MSDFEDEKKWENVNSSRSKGKKWEPSSGVDQKKAEQLSAGLHKSPREVFFEAMDIWAGKGKKKPKAAE